MKGIADLLGRIFLGMISIYEGLNTLFFYSNTKETMSSYGVTYMQDTLLYLTIISLILCSVMVIIGYWARFGAAILSIYWIVVTLIVYSFWNDPPDLQGINAYNFMQNLAIIGGLLMLIANGAQEYSIKRLIYVVRLPK